MLDFQQAHWTKRRRFSWYSWKLVAEATSNHCPCFFSVDSFLDMDSYAPLLERTRVPQPSLQRLAVISIFEKLRSAPSYIDSDSDPGTDAISQCLHSTSPAVVDQAVRELCRLVTDSKMELSRGLLELQSAIEGSNSRFVNVFVKAIGFLVHVGFQKNISLFRVESPESHPFVKVRAITVRACLVLMILYGLVKGKIM